MKETGLSRNRGFGIVLHILFWSMAYFLLFQAGQSRFAEKAEIWMPFPFLLVHAILVYSNIYFLLPRFFFRKKFWVYGLTILGIFLISLIMLFLIMEWTGEETTFQITKFDPDGNILGVIHDRHGIKRGRITVINFFFLFSSTIFGLGREFLRRERERANLEQERLKAEMKFLRAQINPHFLFNVMNNLYATVKLQPSKAGELISKISDMLRYVIYDCSKPKVSIGKEAEYLKSYVFFQEMKDPDRIRIKLEILLENEDFAVEPMLLLPFVENAFKHSYSDVAEEIHVRIFLKANSDGIEFFCQNSLPLEQAELEKDPSHSGIGIKNVKSRLDFSHSGKYALDIRKSEETFEVNLNLQK